jgi:hypothetical protein
MQATPRTDAVSPVTPAELASFIGGDANDPLLPMLLSAATDAAIRYLNLDLAQREWVGIIPKAYLRPFQLSPMRDTGNVFELPYTNLLSVESVSIDGQTVEFTLEAERRPARITLPSWDGSEVRVEYTAGMDVIPAAIKLGITTIAAFMFDHRGACDAEFALAKSGAMNFLKPYRVEVSL